MTKRRMPTLNGLNIFVSPLLPRKVQSKRHKRIDKKWLKRYSYKLVDEAIITPHGVYVSQRAFAQLKAMTRQQEFRL